MKKCPGCGADGIKVTLDRSSPVVQFLRKATPLDATAVEMWYCPRGCPVSR